MDELNRVIERVQAAYGNACFACGRDNHVGLHLELIGLEDGWVNAKFSPRPDYRGAPGMLHGGIAATALDEILVWAGIVMEGVMTVTGTLDLKYRRPISVDDDLIAQGRVIDRSGRRMVAEGRLLVEDRVAAEAKGLYLVSATVADLGMADPR